MTDELPTVTFKAIGIVRNGITERKGTQLSWRGVVSNIVINPSLTEALEGLEEYSHIIVLFWPHQVDTTAELPTKRHPMRREELPLVGILAWRSPERPNPIGKTTARLLQRQGNILRVEGLDALDGTPIIDIKPYIPEWDSATDAKVPQWLTNQ